MRMSNSEGIPTIYGRMIGVIELYCPKCGYLMRNRTSYKGPWVFQCGNKFCLRHWVIGLAVRPAPSGPRSVPPDTIFPPPRWVREKWKANTNINTLEPNTDDTERNGTATSL
jgi:hypothetical protein